MLTDAKVRTAKPRPKAYKIADANKPFLLVAPGGGKLWRWNYAYDGKNRTMAFGTYPARATSARPDPHAAQRASRRARGPARRVVRLVVHKDLILALWRS